jgi:hypothetical protein
MTTKDIIDLLNQETFFVTIYDSGAGNVRFCLAVQIHELEDLYYLGKALSALPPLVLYYTKTNLAYFPEVEIDAETYAYILKE